LKAAGKGPSGVLEQSAPCLSIPLIREFRNSVKIAATQATKREAPRFPGAPLFVRGVSRILFRRACLRRSGDGHSSHGEIASAARCLATRMRPIPETGPGVSPATGQATQRLCLALHRMGFIVPRRLPRGRWAFTPPFHPYRNAHPSAPRRSVFCDTFHRPGLSPRPSADFSAACCLVVFGLSSPAETGATICPSLK
jgi:hypothetical protein